MWLSVLFYCYRYFAANLQHSFRQYCKGLLRQMYSKSLLFWWWMIIVRVAWIFTALSLQVTGRSPSKEIWKYGQFHHWWCKEVSGTDIALDWCFVIIILLYCWNGTVGFYHHRFTYQYPLDENYSDWSPWYVWTECFWSIVANLLNIFLILLLHGCQKSKAKRFCDPLWKLQKRCKLWKPNQLKFLSISCCLHKIPLIEKVCVNQIHTLILTHLCVVFQSKESFGVLGGCLASGYLLVFSLNVSVLRNQEWAHFLVFRMDLHRWPDWWLGWGRERRKAVCRKGWYNIYWSQYPRESMVACCCSNNCCWCWLNWSHSPDRCFWHQWGSSQIRCVERCSGW